MNFAMSVVTAAGLLAAAGMLSYGPGGDRQALAASPMPQAQAPDGDTFHARSNHDAACAITRGDPVSEGRSALRVEPSCAALLPGLERAKFWHEREDGSVVFTENGVDPIVAFAVADGVAYESFEPSTPLISLDAAD